MSYPIRHIVHYIAHQRFPLILLHYFLQCHGYTVDQEIKNGLSHGYTVDQEIKNGLSPEISLSFEFVPKVKMEWKSGLCTPQKAQHCSLIRMNYDTVI